MKKYFTITSNFTLKSCLLLIITAIFIYSCKKELWSVDTNNQSPIINEINLETLKLTYTTDTTASKFTTFATGQNDSRIIKNRNILWDRIYYLKRDSSRVMEFDMEKDNMMLSYTEDPKNTVNKNSLVFLEFNNGKRLNFYMKIVEDLNVDSKSVIKSVHYRSIPVNFNGAVFFYTIDRQFINGYQYANGKVKAKILTKAAGTSSALQVTSTDSKKTAGYVGQVYCYEYYSYNYSIDNDEWYWVDCNFQECHILYTYVKDTLDDDPNPGIDGDSGSNNPPPPCSTPTNNPSPGNPNPTPTDPNQPPYTTINSIKVIGGHATVMSMSPDCPPVIDTLFSDTLKRDYPCAKKIVIDSLAKIKMYQDFLLPFLTNRRPNLTWRNDNLPWNLNNIYTLGVTQGSTTGTGTSSTITLNTSMLQNSSLLLIVASSIHETIHAYLNFAKSSASYNANNHWIDTTNTSWLLSMDNFIFVNGLPANYSDHSQMLNDYFDSCVAILAKWDGNQHSMQEYRMTMLFGLDNPGVNSTPVQRDSLKTYFTRIRTKYGIIDTLALKHYFGTQLNSSSNKLPTSGCN